MNEQMNELNPRNSMDIYNYNYLTLSLCVLYGAIILEMNNFLLSSRSWPK